MNSTIPHSSRFEHLLDTKRHPPSNVSHNLGTLSQSPSILPRHPHSLQHAAEQQEQRLALAEDGQAAAGREAAELRATLRGLERDRLDARRELQELRRQVKGGDDNRGIPSHAV